jgi:DNA-binding transcriptional LysR family regulator
MIGAGLAEAGVVSDAVDVAGLAIQPLISDHLVLIIPVAHRFAGSKAVCFADVTGGQFVGLEAGSALQDHIDQHAVDLRKTLAFRIRMKSFEGGARWCRRGVAGGSDRPTGGRKALSNQVSIQNPHVGDDWARRQLCLRFQQWHTLSAPMQSLLAHLGDGAETW